MSNRAEINGVPMWYDQRGGGPVVVLMHGGLTDSRDFSGNLDALQSHFTVYLPERRGHGHTPDAGGALTIEEMAGDMEAFLESVVGEPASLVGYSAGAAVAINVAVRRPELVQKLVAISGAVTAAGWLVRPVAGGTPPEPLLRAYAEVSPDGPDHFAVVIDKVAAAAEGEGLDLEQLTKVTAPTLLVYGDDDIVSLEHAIALYRAIREAALSIVPYASHLLLHEHSRHVTELVSTFLRDGQAPTLMPIARAAMLADS